MDATRSKYYGAAACLAGLALTAGAMAQETTVSSAFCSVRSISQTAAVMQSAYTNAWLDVGAFVCGSAGEADVVNINEQVSDIAFAIAEAFAEVSVNCRAQGNAEVRAQGYAFAEQRAEALGTAVTSIFASAEVCNSCSATVDVLTETTMELISVAVAEAWTDIYLFADGGVDEEIETVTSNVIVETIADVLSSITGEIRAGAEEGCSLDIINSASVGDFFAECEVITSADADEEVTNAIADAAAEAIAYACDGDVAEAAVTVSATAVATALARAVAQADIFCETVGIGPETSACALTQANVEAVAIAQAEAFASAFAAASTCDCDVSATASVSVFAEILVEAAVNVYAETCISGTDYSFVTDFQFALEERMLTATAVAIATAVADASTLPGNTCRISSDVCAAASMKCVENFELCGGTTSGFADGEVRPCCDPDYRCFIRNPGAFFCRRRTSRLPRSWDGRIAECTLDLLDSAP